MPPVQDAKGREGEASSRPPPENPTMTAEIAVSITMLVLVWAIGVLCGIAYVVKRGYLEAPLLRVGWAIMDDQDIVLGYAKSEEEFGATMRDHNYATAKPMYVKVD